MPTFDAPISTDDRNIARVMQQPLPLMLIFHRDDIRAPLDEALRKAAKAHAGDVLFVRMHVDDSRDTFLRYGEPPTPSLVALTNGDKRKVKTDAERITPADVDAHLAHLLQDAPLPQAQPTTQRAPAHPVTVTDSTFRQEVLKSKTPVLVDFWAAWCGPCHAIAPTVEQLATEHSGKLKVAKLDVDNNPTMARRYGVQSIPTFIIFENGQIAQRMSGANPVALRNLAKTYAR